MTTRVVVEGVLPRTQNSPPRVEISTFVRNIRHFSLYVQALDEIYVMDRNNPRSFWQIAGIHGEPLVDYEGVSSGRQFFCAHRSKLFLTWHRPYVVLLEQEIQRLARQIALRYTYERPQWQMAAESLRQPYWGWDNRTTVVLPDQIILSDVVMIRRPQSPNLVAVSNPFLAFTYPAGANGSGALRAPFNRWPRTVRHPDAQGNSQRRRLLAELQAVTQANGIVNNAQRLYSIRTWRKFTLGSSGTSGLESIHDSIHRIVGGLVGPGNMATEEAAAFDPIFWLHHAQVDRVVDLWQRLHGVWPNNGSNLLPFRRNQTTFWQSLQMSNGTSIFNYSYMASVAMPRIASASGVVEDSEENEIAEVDVSAGASYVTLEWSVRVQCKEFEVGGTFSVFILLSDELPPDHDEWLFHPAFVGTFDVFANSSPDRCLNCTSHSDDLVKGYVHINDQYLERSGQTSLQPAVVLRYLKENLSWGVVKTGGEVVDLETFPSLEVTVLCMPLKYIPDEEYPIEEEPTVYPDITRGRPGGDHSD